MIILRKFSDNRPTKLKFKDRFLIGSRPFFSNEAEMQAKIDAYQNNNYKKFAQMRAAYGTSVSGAAGTGGFVAGISNYIKKHPNSRFSRYCIKDTDRDKVALGQMTREEFANKWYKKK